MLLPNNQQIHWLYEAEYLKIWCQVLMLEYSILHNIRQLYIQPIANAGKVAQNAHFAFDHFNHLTATGRLIDSAHSTDIAR